MKKLSLLFCMMLISAFTFSQWTWQNPLPQGNTLLSVYFTSPNTGYAVGYHGTILKTTDGGSNWSQQTSGTDNSLNSIYFTSVDTGYIAGGYSGELIYKTTNGGNSWSVQYSDSTIPSSLSSVYFVNSSLGFAVGYNGKILKTTDGGTTWTPKFSGTTSTLVSVFFTDLNTGYVAGGDGLILKTTNAGNSWSTLTTGTIYSVNSLYFTDINTGYAVTGTEILKTVNGGSTWTSYSIGTGNRLMSIHFSDPNNGCTVSEFGRIYKTNDAGTTWTEQTSGTTNWLWSVFFADNNTGFSVGDNGTIIKTTDGGINWNSLTIGTTKGLSSVVFTDNYTGYTVGADGIILKTINGGENWIQKTSGTIDTLRSVFFTDQNTGYAVGNSGTIIKTLDAGNTWITQTTGVFYNLYSVFMIDSLTGYSVGKGGMIVKTTDGGNTWNPISFNVYGDLTSVYFTDANTGYAVGVSGKIIKTTNGGSNWTVQASGTVNELTSVYFINNNTGFIVGISGTVLKTIDGGNNWIADFSGMNYWLYSVYYTDSLTGYAVGSGNYGGIIIKTTDGGNSWNAESLLSYSVLSSVYVTGAGCYAVGYNGTILSTSIIPNCNVSFQSFASPTGNVGFTTTATVSDSLAYPITYSWSFGDGTSSTTNFDTISHIYNAPGYYNACVIMQTANGCTSSFCDTITFISPTCLANFSYLIDSINQNGTTYSFVDASIPDSSATVITYLWDFSDSTSSTLQNPVHIFTLSGTYSICLTITTSSGCTSTSCTNISIMNPSGPCQTFFYYTPDSLNMPPATSFSFYDQSVPDSSGTITSWNWSFSGGNPSSSTLQNPQGIIFNSPGDHLIWLNITTSSGCTSFYIDTITIANYPCQLYANISSQGPSVIGGNDGNIKTYVYGGTPPYTYSWNTGQTTPCIYNLTSGLYLLNVTDANGCNNIFTVKLYEPYDTTGGPIVDTLTTSILDTCLNFVPDSFYISTVVIDSINNVATVTWVFVGNGTTSSLTVDYQYFQSGNNAILLTLDCGTKNLTSYMSFIHISASVGIESIAFDKQDLLAYPVPFGDVLNINFTINKSGKTTIYLLDATGRMVANKTIETMIGVNSSEINTSNLPLGYYILNVENNGQILRKSVVK